MLDHDYGSAAERVAESLRPDLSMSCSLIYSQVAKYCESPIEAMLGTAILIGFGMVEGTLSTKFFCFSQQSQMENIKTQFKPKNLLVPQYTWNNYRIDWMVYDEGLKPPFVFVECDGHDFHNRSKEQAQRDRERDRAIQSAGIPVIRFTGSEIFRNAAACAIQVAEFLSARWDAQEGNS